MIKNKDGKEYKISSPNPLMRFQELWKEYTTYNFFWEEIKQKFEEQKFEEQKFEDECFYIEAKTSTKKDNLYEEVKIQIKYKEKILIKIKIEEYDDLYLSFIFDKKLNKNSIIFPKNKNKRWWKITKEEQKQDLYFYYCIPSDFNPSLA